MAVHRMRDDGVEDELGMIVVEVCDVGLSWLQNVFGPVFWVCTIGFF